jgi:alkanesulfonate monooxygenase SsuD/methylene tetrahydromethanopterin reductase-like flavin-dependent oxidoreductase (luciferase family)
VRAHNEKRFSVPWSAPAPRMREYVESLRAIWRCWEKGEELSYRGLHPFCTRRYLDEIVVRELRAGMLRSGRARERFEISGGGFIATGPDDESVAKMVDAMSKAGQWDRVAAEISDDVVRLFAAVGPHRELAREIERRFGGVSDSVGPSGGYGVRQDVPPDLIQDIRRIPSAFTGYQTAW